MGARGEGTRETETITQGRFIERATRGVFNTQSLLRSSGPRAGSLCGTAGPLKLFEAAPSRLRSSLLSPSYKPLTRSLVGPEAHVTHRTTMPPSRSRCDSRASEQGPYESVVASEPRRTVKQAHPLPKGAACIPCTSHPTPTGSVSIANDLGVVLFAGSTRRVRCSGERPACAACVRHARWNGNNPKKNHGCCYKPSKAEAEQAEEEEDEQQELRSAKDKITELEDKICT